MFIHVQKNNIHQTNFFFILFLNLISETFNFHSSIFNALLMLINIQLQRKRIGVKCFLAAHICQCIINAQVFKPQADTHIRLKDSRRRVVKIFHRLNIINPSAYKNKIIITELHANCARACDDDAFGQRLFHDLLFISYHPLAQLGAGGMATVYKAYHAAMDRYVAIKVLPQHLARDPNFRARFQQEARVIARLEHWPMNLLFLTKVPARSMACRATASC